MSEYGFTGNISHYTGLDLPPDFWATCWRGNKNNPSLLFAAVGSHEFIIPLAIMRALACTCKWYFGIIHCKVMECNRLRDKWGPILIKKYIPYLIYRSHPFKYTGVCSKIIPIDDNMTANVTYGLCPLDEQHRPIFSEVEHNSIQYSLVDVGFFTHKPIAFHMVLFMCSAPIVSESIQACNYIDRGPLTPRLTAIYTKKYGNDTTRWPGRYYIPMRLATTYNPIILGGIYIPMFQLHLCIMSDNTITMRPDFPFILEHFTHVIMKFRTVSITDYEWKNYGFRYIGCMDTYIKTHPLAVRNDMGPANEDQSKR